MIPSELRKKAREALKDNWGNGILLGLAYFLFGLVLNSLGKIFFSSNSLSLAYSIIKLIITVPIAFGLSISFLNLKRHKESTAFSFVTEGFSRFGKCWNVYLWVLVKMLLPICCFLMAIVLLVLLTLIKVKLWVVIIVGLVAYLACIVYAISRGLLYSLVYYITADEPHLTGKEVVNKSEKLMKGNRGNLLLLELSFMGWILLGFLSLGIGFIWIVPYLQVSVACFYDELIGNKETKSEEPEKIEEPVQE